MVKGTVLAGGTGTRPSPLTPATSKQLGADMPQADYGRYLTEIAYALD